MLMVLPMHKKNYQLAFGDALSAVSYFEYRERRITLHKRF